MILKNNYLSNQAALFDMINTASKVLLPMALALLVSGAIWFEAALHYFDINHPTWPVWLIVISITGWRALLGGINHQKLHPLDILMIIFIILVAVSQYFKGMGNHIRAVHYIGAYIGLSYIAGRLLRRNEIKIFLYAIFFIVCLSIPLIIVEMLSLPEWDYLHDRVRGLFGAYYINNHIGMTVGSLCVLLLSGVVFLRAIPFKFKILASIILAISYWLLVFVAARAGLVSAVIVSFFILFIIKSASFKLRSTIFLSVMLLIAISLYTVPPERLNFLLDVVHVENILSVNEVVEKTPREEQCYYTGNKNSVISRLQYYQDALRIFRNEPLFGIGAGNFGFDKICRTNTEYATPHSSILQTFSELGIVGGVIFLAMAAFIFNGLLRIIIHKKNQPDHMVFLVLPLYFFMFLLDQISGNYFTGYQFYVISGVAGSVLAVNFHNEQKKI